MNFKQAHTSNFKCGRPGGIKYIVIHYTANNGDTAKNNADYFANNGNILASAHYFVDENAVWQSVKDTDTAYHCGTTGVYKHPLCRNTNSIGIEMCSRKDANGKYYFKDATVKNAADLTKELIKKYNIPKENVIRHYDVTGKVCPAPMVTDESLWKEFKSMLTSKPKLVSGNDIVWELMNGKHKVKISEVKKAVKALDMAKNNPDYNSLYWILYKLVNGNE
jgi:N-acetylmuramoyl-L-alanine amidase CwlA